MSRALAAQCRFRTVVIRTAVAIFSHRCRIALLAFALLTFALLSLRTVDPFALLAFALLASHWCRSHFCLSHSCRTSRLFDRLPVRISTSDLHHWILRKKIFHIRAYDFGVQFSFKVPKQKSKNLRQHFVDLPFFRLRALKPISVRRS